MAVTDGKPAAGDRPNPFVGPRPYDRRDVVEGRRLFGRDREVAKLLNLMVAERIVLVHSPSGAGKTSLIEAALVPRLAERGFAVLPRIRLNLEPPREVGAAGEGPNRYVRSALHSLDKDLPPDRQRTAAELASMDLATYLDAGWRAGEGPTGEEAGGEGPDADEPIGQVLIFDQFEDVLTLDPIDDEAKKAFFAQLGGVLRDRGRWALFAIREDHVGALQRYVRAIPTRLATTFRLDLLDEQAAREAIQGPARRAGVELGDLAAAKLVDDLRRMLVQRPDGTTEPGLGLHVEPVQLQVVCYRLWEGLAPGAREITGRDVDALGNVDNALADYYAERVAAIAGETGTPQRVIRDWCEHQLITEQGLRGQVLLTEGRTKDLDNRTIDRLERDHLVRREERRSRVWYELTHDRLVEPIRKDNAAWRERELAPLQRRTGEWARQGRPRALLLDGDALAVAEQWARAHEGELTREDHDLLRASQDAGERLERERARQAERRTNLAETGWGVVFAAGADPAVREALSPLLDHRRRQAMQQDERSYREFVGPDGYRPGDTAHAFLDRHSARSFVTGSRRVPYYLLIVGGPETIPWEFQYALDVPFAVGRVHFDSLDGYARYAHSVVEAENGQTVLPQRVVIFGPRHHGDRATQVAADHLLRPLAERLAAEEAGWQVEPVLDDARKARLRRYLGGRQTPALLFTASHGLSFPSGDPRQLPEQGALLCQDWSGPLLGQGPPSPEFSFAAGDVAADRRLHGLVAFLWGAYTAGTPHLDDFAAASFAPPREAAPRAFVARLPQRLLGHPNGGALAVLGHVDRPWLTFVRGAGGERESDTLAGVVSRLLRGHTVGSAIEPLNVRYAQLSSRLSEELRRVVFYGSSLADVALELASLDTAATDARNWVTLGDPAVRLAVREPLAEEATAPVPKSVVVPTPPAAALAVGAGVGIVADAGAVGAVAAAAVGISVGDVSLGEDAAAAAPGPGRFIFNGINGATGQYLLPPMAPEEVAAIAQGQELDPAHQAELERHYRQALEQLF